MTDFPENLDTSADLADFELWLIDKNGLEELWATASGPRPESLAEILNYWVQAQVDCDERGFTRRVYEVIRNPVDLPFAQGGAQ